jgi:hypothetical protein
MFHAVIAFLISLVRIMKIFGMHSLHRAITTITGCGKAFRCLVFVLCSIPERQKNMWLKFVKPLRLVGMEEQIRGKKFWGMFSDG